MDPIKLIDMNWEKLLVNLDEKKRNKVGLALHRLKESLKRLDCRYIEYYEVEKMIIFDSTGPRKINLSDLQLKLVDKVEAFHQQVYVVLSTLILAINYLGIRGKKEQHPINSISNFLKFVEKIFQYKNILLEQINNLKHSIEFRAKFIDHPQQHILHNWMTYGFQKECYIIYYIEKSNKVFHRGKPYNPNESGFLPPVDCDNNFYVSPNKINTYKAVQYFVKYLLNIE